MQRIADFITGIDGQAKRRLWQRYLDALSPEATRHWSDLLSSLPGDAWSNLRTSTLQQIDQRDPMRGWPQALDRFNEVRAFVYLQKIGCTDIAFAPTSMAMRGPDLLASRDGDRVACEVKTIIQGTNKPTTDAFVRKFLVRASDAIDQLRASSSGRCITYFVFHLRDPLSPEIRRRMLDANNLSIPDCRDNFEIYLDELDAHLVR